ncbi:MAG: TAT-variant-translocated molybdopterin oxidoreductase [Zavarzinella sp.]
MGETTNLLNTPASGKEQWLGLEELANTPAFQEMLEREFPDDAESWTDPLSRRTFLTLSAASLALAGIGCSPRPASPKKIFPYVRQPEGMTLGLPLFYATTFSQGGVATGVLVKSREGRPIKIEGNPTHPGSVGASSAHIQASLLDLYDPDRSRNIQFQGLAKSWDEATSELRTKFEGLQTKNIRILSLASSSPTLRSVIADFKVQFKNTEWYEYETSNRDFVSQGSQLAFGEELLPVYDFTQATRVLAVDADFLCHGEAAVRYSREFNVNRRVTSKEGATEEKLTRLYAVESNLTGTGSVADHRLALKSTQIDSFIRALANKFGLKVASGEKLPELAERWLDPLFNDLKAHEGKGLVVVGDHQPAAVHAIAHAINQELKAFGKSVTLKKADKTFGSQTANLTKLVDEMKSGKVDALLILGSNPVYDAPVDLGFADALAKVGLKIHMGTHLDETAIKCDWHFPLAHYLETWGDGRGYDGIVSLQQPLIAPLHGARTPLELFVRLFDYKVQVPGPLGAVETMTPSSSMEVVKAYWHKQWKPSEKHKEFQHAWEHWLQDGVIPDSAWPTVEKAPDITNLKESVTKVAAFEVNFRVDPNIHDGRYANNGWLQELPKPITKLTWDNAAIISPKTAKDLGVTVYSERWGGGEHGQVSANFIDISLAGKTLSIPVWIQPGHADDSITLHLGFGRTHAGQVGNEKGFNTFTIRTTSSLWMDNCEKPVASTNRYTLACTQAHHAMKDDSGWDRRPARMGYLPEFQKNPTFASIPNAAKPEKDMIIVPQPAPSKKGHDHGNDGHKHDEHGHEHHVHDKRLIPLTLHPDSRNLPDDILGLHSDDPHINTTSDYAKARRWGMAIDLNTCHGCGVCMIACQAENNIPVVGKDQVTRGREMHWIRVDRYYSGNDPDDAGNIQVHFQPVPCQQCEKAPCEVVCPVAATAHSADGLNDMVYNRCVGTRYCSNNCPYKVRRFNFLTYADWRTDTYKLMRNPEVSVRERGVMEKCTYCVQRIRSAEIEAERQRREILDGEILTACQAACPSGAIAFGNLDDGDSVVSEWKRRPTNYGLLAELNTQPRTTYLAAVRNPNPEMPRA